MSCIARPASLIASLRGESSMRLGFPWTPRANTYAGAMARTVREVAGELDRLERELPRTDGVKWFAWLYADVTRAIVRLFEEQQLQAPDFMADLVIRFGDTFVASVARPDSAPP